MDLKAFSSGLWMSSSTGEYASQVFFDDFVGEGDGVIVLEDVVDLAVEANLRGHGEA